jgi:hypothetical protein
MAQDSDVTAIAEAPVAAHATVAETKEPELELPIRQSSFGTVTPGQTLTGKQEHCALFLPR